MARKSMAELHAALHRQIAETLLAKIEAGEASAHDLNVARAYLKDNNVTGDPERPDASVSALREAMDALELELPN